MCCGPALAVLKNVEDADWRRLPPLVKMMKVKVIGVRREEQFSSKSVHSLRLVVLLKAEGFAWPTRTPVVLGGHSPRSVGCSSYSLLRAPGFPVLARCAEGGVCRSRRDGDAASSIYGAGG